MGTQTRLRHAAVKPKARFHEHAAKAKVSSKQGLGSPLRASTKRQRNKAILPLTIPHRIFKSSVKDSTHRWVGIILRAGPRSSSVTYARHACY